MKILLTALLCLCSLFIFSQNQEWKKSFGSNKFTRTRCITDSVIYPRWYNRLLTEEQIRSSVFDGKIFDVNVTQTDSLWFEGVMMFHINNTYTYHIAFQQEKPAPIIVSGEPNLSRFNILSAILLCLAILLHWLVIRRKKYLVAVLLDICAISVIAMTLYALLEKSTPVFLCAFGLVILILLYVSIKTSHMGITVVALMCLFVNAIVATIIFAINRYTTLEIGIKSVIPILALPVVGILATCFFWIRSRNKSEPIPQKSLPFKGDTNYI